MRRSLVHRKLLGSLRKRTALQTRITQKHIYSLFYFILGMCVPRGGVNCFLGSATYHMQVVIETSRQMMKHYRLYKYYSIIGAQIISG